VVLYNAVTGVRRLNKSLTYLVASGLPEGNDLHGNDIYGQSEGRLVVLKNWSRFYFIDWIWRSSALNSICQTFYNPFVV